MLRRLDSGILVGTSPATPVDTASGTGIAGDESTMGTMDLTALGESLGHTPLVVPVRGHLDSIKRLLRGDVYIGRGSRQRSLPKSRCESLGHTPLVVPVRGHLDSIKRLLRGDVYIGRGSRQRSLPKSRYCNTFKVSQVGRSVAISSFREALRADPVLLNSHWTLSGTRLVFHCRATEGCHGDVLIEEFRKLYPAAHDRNQPRGAPPGHEIQTRASLAGLLVTEVMVHL